MAMQKEIKMRTNLRVPVEKRLNGCFGLDVARSTWQLWKWKCSFVFVWWKWYDESESGLMKVKIIWWKWKWSEESESGRCPLNLTIVMMAKVTHDEKLNDWGKKIMTWLVLHTSLCLFFSCSHWIISTLQKNSGLSHPWKYWTISIFKVLKNTELFQPKS